MKTGPAPILVATCGNALAGDDAVGPLVLLALCEQDLDNVQLLNLATAPSMLLDYLPRRRMLIIIDAAVIPDRPPGQVIVCDWDSPERSGLACELHLSTHGVSLPSQIELARELGWLPRRVILVAITIAAANQGTDVCEAVQRAVPIAAQRVRELLADDSSGR